MASHDLGPAQVSNSARKAEFNKGITLIVGDFIERLDTQNKERCDVLCHFLAPRGQRLLQLEKLRNHRAGRFLVDVVQVEELLAHVMCMITCFWKQRKHPSWPRTGFKTLLKRIKATGMIKRESVLLRTHISDWLQSHTICNNIISASPKKIRTDHTQFWSEYHQILHRPELASTLACNDDAHHIMGQRLVPSSKCKQDATGFEVHQKYGQSDDVLKQDVVSRSRRVSRSFMQAKCATRQKGRRNLRDEKSAFKLPEIHPTNQVSSLERKLPHASRESPSKSDHKRRHHSGHPDALHMYCPRNDRLNMLGTFVRPHNVDMIDASANMVSRRYLRACDKFGVLPLSLPFVTGESKSLHVAGHSLSDSDLRAISHAIKSMSAIVEVDLEGSALLTDDSMVPFIDKLHGRPAAATLQVLSFKGCLRVGRQGIESVVQLLTDPQGALKLRRLDLSGVHVSSASHLSCCKAIGRHPALHTICLSDTKFGASAPAVDVQSCIVHLLGCKTLEVLDLSWNHMSVDTCTNLGTCLRAAKALRTLNLAHCSAAFQAAVGSIVFFLEALALNCKLTDLDISSNNIDFRGALVLEDALDRNASLTKLNISSNPICNQGVRCIVRLLAKMTCGLTHVECRDCNMMAVPTGDLPFPSMTQPDGRYSLDLSNPYHRACLRLLYKVCERLELANDDAFTITASTPPYTCPSKDAYKEWNVPLQGTLDLNFSLQSLLQQSLRSTSCAECWDFESYVRKWRGMMRLPVDDKKKAPIVAMWRYLEGRPSEHRILLQAFAEELRLDLPFVEQLCYQSSDAREVIMNLLPIIDGGPPARYLSMMLVPTMSDMIIVLRKLNLFLAFNVENPTAHYRINLSNVSDVAVLEAVIVLDQWEICIGKQQGFIDFSKNGNFSRIRNECYQGKSIVAPSLAGWKLPQDGPLDFDYVSSKRPHERAVPLDDHTLATLLLALQQSNCSEANRVKVLRLVSHHLFFSAVQIRDILDMFRDKNARHDIVVALFFRVVDIQNEKVFRARLNDNADFACLQKHLGFITMFPFAQPEQVSFTFNLSIYEERLTASLLIQLAAAESWVNLKDVSLEWAEGGVHPLERGVNSAWTDFEKMPKSGVFRLRYACSPSSRNCPTRARLLKTYGLWHIDLQDNTVEWCTRLQDTPDDVCALACWLASHFGDFTSAFRFFDSIGESNGVLTLRKLEDGIDRKGCQIFDGADKTKRIETIFRFMDPNSDGQIPAVEWHALSQVWREFQLTIGVLIRFLERNLGHSRSDWWTFIDKNGNGELDVQEWSAALEELGFFGPTADLFIYLDKDHRGTISSKEFAALEPI